MSTVSTQMPLTRVLKGFALSSHRLSRGDVRFARRDDYVIAGARTQNENRSRPPLFGVDETG